jgi:hypothetical protein
MTGCDDPFEHSKTSCLGTEIRRIPSPDGELEARVYEEFCKPDLETVVATRVDLTPPDRILRKKLDENPLNLPFQQIFKIRGKHLINIIWLDPTHLQIECPGARADEIKNQEKEWHQINISYKF